VVVSNALLEEAHEALGGHPGDNVSQFPPRLRADVFVQETVPELGMSGAAVEQRGGKGERVRI
jgi:hypothetical protein